MEKKNVDLITRGRGVSDADVSESYRSCCELLCRRGTQLAPSIEGKIDSKELIDGELREALRKSKEVSALLRASPSFCAWF